MASKEVMVSAPVMVLLFERTFVAGSLREAIRRSWPLYIRLAATWLPALALWFFSERDVLAGFGLGVSAVDWWLTQSKVLLMYLKLAIWPWPLLIHYQLHYLKTFGESWFYVVPVLLLALATLILLVRNRASGFLGAWVFAILLPTSAVPILLETAAERRMYLPLAALITLAVVAVYRVFKRTLGRQPAGDRLQLRARLQRVVIALAILISFLYGVVSANRVNAYHDELNLWIEVFRHNPDDFLAHSNAGILLNIRGDVPEAIAELRTAVAMEPDDSDSVTNLAALLTTTGKVAESIDLLEKYLARNPKDAVAHNNLGTALAKVGRRDEALEHFQIASQLHPKYAEAHKNRGIVLAEDKTFDEAIKEFRQALMIDSNYVDALFNLGTVLFATGDASDAISYLQQATRLQPNRADRRKILGDALRNVGRLPAAIQQYQLAVSLNPDDMKAYSELAASLASAGRSQEAIETAETAVSLARSKNDEAKARQIEGWLKNYKAGLARPYGAAPQESAKPQK